MEEEKQKKKDEIEQEPILLEGLESPDFSMKDIKEKSIGELYNMVKLPQKVMDDILHIGDDTFEKMVKEKYKLNEDKEEEERKTEKLIEVYRVIIDILKDYSDINERYYPIIATWIIGTYFHKDFPTYPYLFFNAMKGSGKSRTVRLITYLSNEGSMLSSLTEAVLFRTKGTLGIDEFEGVTRKGSEALRELLNCAYKQGSKVKRMKKVKTLTGEEQVVEEYDVFRPLIMANINGMDDVLGDRCISIILEKSNNLRIIKKMEIFDIDTKIIKIKQFPFEECRKWRVDVSRNLYIGWNKHINNIYNTNNTNNNNNNNDTNNTFILFDKIDKTGIDGRSLELAFPLLIISSWFGEECFDEMLDILKKIMEERKKEDSIESLDISLIDFISQEVEGEWNSIKDIFSRFKEFVQVNEDWFNEKWLGRALKRLNLIKDKKRMNYGRIVLLDIKHAQEKIKMFK